MTPLEAIQSGFILIVPNQRLQQYWTLQALKHFKALQGSPVQSYRSFILHRIALKPWDFQYKVLSDPQAVLWIAHVLAKDAPLTTMHVSLAQTTYQAYQRMKRWQITIPHLQRYFMNPAQKIFIQNVEQIERAKESHCIRFLEDCADLLLQDSPNVLGKEPLYWYGFDDWTPLQEALYKACKAHQPLTCCEPLAPSLQWVCPKYIYSTPQEEWSAALSWLTSQDPSKRCAIVVSDLQNDYEDLKRYALQLCDPLLSALPLDQMSQQLSFSHGVPLSTLCPVSALLKALQFRLCVPLGVEETVWIDMFQPSDAHNRIGLWIDWLLHVLRQTQWLESFPLTSQEYQGAQAFWLQCEALKDLSGLFKPICWSDFVQYLSAALTLSLFQAQSLNKNHIVLGLLEASALPWDAIWLIHADRSRFPQSLKKHPLIADPLQEFYQFPHASLERETQYLKKILSRLLSQSRSVTLSYATTLSASYVASPSFIIESLIPGDYHVQAKTPPSVITRIIFASQPSPKVNSTLSLSQVESLRACLFQGWAKTLRHSQPAWTQPPLFDPREYGIFIHHAIQGYIQSGSFIAPMPAQWTAKIVENEYMRLNAAIPLLQKEFIHEAQDILCEHTISLSLSGFTIKGRIDIFDRLHNRVIDIKTRKTSLSPWIADEPTHWQGPVYALAVEAETLGLLCVSDGGMIYKDHNIMQYKEAWTIHLKKLLNTWAQGMYPAVPTEESACRICTYKPACRYHWVSPATHEMGV